MSHITEIYVFFLPARATGVALVAECPFLDVHLRSLSSLIPISLSFPHSHSSPPIPSVAHLYISPSTHTSMPHPYSSHTRTISRPTTSNPCHPSYFRMYVHIYPSCTTGNRTIHVAHSHPPPRAHESCPTADYASLKM